MPVENTVSKLKLCVLLSNFAKNCIFDKPQEDCFMPITQLMRVGWTKYAHEHPEEKDIYKNGIYMNDESAQIGEALVYACVNVDLSNLLPKKEISEEIVNEFRRNLCVNYYDYLENLYKQTGEMPYVYNKNTLNWDNFHRITHDSTKFGKTLSL